MPRSLGPCTPDRGSLQLEDLYQEESLKRKKRNMQSVTLEYMYHNKLHLVGEVGDYARVFVHRSSTKLKVDQQSIQLVVITKSVTLACLRQAAMSSAR